MRIRARRDRTGSKLVWTETTIWTVIRIPREGDVGGLESTVPQGGRDAVSCDDLGPTDWIRATVLAAFDGVSGFRADRRCLVEH
jgi:hypothetical protein